MSVAVLVKFENESYNYKTRVSGTAGEEGILAYFVGQYFDVGTYPVENIQKSIGIEFIN